MSDSTVPNPIRKRADALLKANSPQTIYAAKPAQAIDFASITGAVLAFGALFVAVILEGGDLKSLIHLPAAILVFGGTIGAGVMSFRANALLQIPALLKRIFTEQRRDVTEVIYLITRFADKARREGLLSLENDARAQSEPLFKQGIFLVIDGTDAETIREVLSTDLHYQEMRYRAEESIFTTLGGYAPTLGIIGTVMGLIHMLAQLNDPGKMGPLISGAFMATLYGVTSANLIFLPIAHKLRAIASEELLIQEVILEGVIAIQSGNSPRLVEERLKSFVTPRQREMTPSIRGAERR